MSYKMKEVTISPAMNGWKVKLGHMEILFIHRETMLYEIEKYILHPEKIEEEYRETEKNEPADGSIDFDGTTYRLGI